MASVAALLASLSACDGTATTPTPTPTPTEETGETPPPPPVPTETGTTAPPPPVPLELCINEILPANATALADDSGAYPDWFELHNPGAEEVRLEGWRVSDGGPLFELDASLVVPPGGFLVLFADGDVDQGPEHVAFQLAAEGEQVGLFAPDGRGSVVEWDGLESDQALARVTDCCEGEGCWEAIPRGSPGATNEGPVLVEESVLAPGSTFTWWEGPGPPPAGWEQPSFDDTAWRQGRAPLGFGGDEETTLPEGPGAALRRHVAVRDAPASVRLRLRRDDGVLVWLDGVEILRDNLPEGPLTPTTTALEPIDGAAEVVWSEHTLDPALFAPGPHVLAITVLQAVPDGNDLLLDAELLLGTWGSP